MLRLIIIYWYYILLAILIFVLLLVLLFMIVFRKFNADYIQRTKDKSINGKYTAVVLTNKSRKDENFIYFSGIMFLIKYFEKNKIPFKLMKKFDKEKFKEFVYDPNCDGLYIIGHGVRHGLVIDKNEILYYCSFRNAPKNKFVVQLHCNKFGGESLADIIGPDIPQSFVTDGSRYSNENLAYFLDRYQPSFKERFLLLPIIHILDVIANICKTIYDR